MIRLCSTSSTRAKLLKEFGIDFIQSPVDFDEEQIESLDANYFVYHASKGKLKAAEAIYGCETPLLCADTVIAADNGEILRKAKTAREAEYILRKISASQIAIITCAHLKSTRYHFIDLSATHYRFAPFDEKDLQRYLNSKEWIGKAGACMVEGFCKPYILEVRGLKSTAMGLQVEIIAPWIKE